MKFYFNKTEYHVHVKENRRKAVCETKQRDACSKTGVLSAAAKHWPRFRPYLSLLTFGGNRRRQVSCVTKHNTIVQWNRLYSL